MITNGQARGVLPRGHSLLVTRARSIALAEADLVIVVGVPLDFRLKYGSFGPKDAPAKVVHVADSPAGIAAHCPLAASAAGDLTAFFTAVTDAWGAQLAGDPDWLPRLRETARASAEADAPLLASEADPIHPMRVYGELLKVLADDAVVIGDGGDFVSFAGRLVEPAQPGRWLDPGPYGCLGTGLGYAIAARLAHPSSQVALMLGDGAAGPVADGRRHPRPPQPAGGHDRRQQLGLGPGEGADASHLRLRRGGRPAPRHPVRRGGARPRRRRRAGRPPGQMRPALGRAFASGVPYLINVITDVAAAYPRTTTGV